MQRYFHYKRKNRNKRMKRITSFIIAAVMTFMLLPAAVYAESADGSGEIITASVSVIDEAALDAKIEEIVTSAGRSKDSVSVALYYTGTGEYYYYNANRWWYTASLFKLPMVMKITRMEVEGELDSNNLVMNIDLETAKEKILRDSNNSWAYGLLEKIFKNDIKYVRSNDLSFSEGFIAEELPAGFYRGYLYSARFYLGIIKELYTHASDYPNVIRYMCEASPTKYFHKVLGDSYRIAQKYGSAGHVVHAGGIIYTPEPVLLVVMNNGVEDIAGNRVVGEISAYIAGCAEEWHLALQNKVP